MSDKKPNAVLWILVTVSALSSILAVIALATAIITSSDRITESQLKISRLQYAVQLGRVSRQQAAEDTCRLLRAMVSLAAGPSAIRQTQANQFLVLTGLSDCQRYAQRVTTIQTSEPHDQPDPYIHP